MRPWGLVLALGCAPKEEPCTDACLPPGEPITVVNYHGDAARLGWNDQETVLTPAVVRGGLATVWNSEPFDALEWGGVSYAPHLYASPLWIDGVELSVDPWVGVRSAVVVAATSNGWVYGVAAATVECGECPGPAGKILWRTRLVDVAPLQWLDGGMPMGVLSTPIADLEADPPRLLVAAMDVVGWRVFALDLGSGAVLDGWPVAIDDESLGAVNTNGPARFQDPVVMSQRGALRLSPDGDRLYVAFGTYWGQGARGQVRHAGRRPRGRDRGHRSDPGLRPAPGLAGLDSGAGPRPDMR